MQDKGSVVGSGEQPKGGSIEVIATPSSRPSPSTPIASPMRTGPEKGLAVVRDGDLERAGLAELALGVAGLLDTDGRVPPPLAQAWPIG